MEAAVCFCGQLRTMPSLAPMLRAFVVEALPADSFLSVQTNFSDLPSEHSAVSTIVSTLSPRRVVVFNDPLTDKVWLQQLPADRLTFLPAAALFEGMDESVTHNSSRCGMGIRAGVSFYSNFCKIHACFGQVNREEHARSRTANPSRYTFVITMRTDIWFGQPMPRLAQLPTHAISVPFCQPSPLPVVRSGRCGPRGSHDASGRGLSSCDEVTDWMAIVPREHARAYFYAYSALRRDGSCDWLRVANGAMCHCHDAHTPTPECILSRHLHAKNVPYQRLSLGVLSIARSVALPPDEPTRPQIASNIVIDANGMNVGHLRLPSPTICKAMNNQTDTRFLCQRERLTS
jgi:hypothetical protein